jgi:hypothetical protein
MPKLLAKVFFLLISLVAISSCSRDSCKHVTCPSNLECSHGACVCPDGYEGANCDTLSYKKFIGNYQVSESCNNFSIYNVTLFWQGDTLLPGQVGITPFFQTAPLYVNIVNIPGSLGLNFNVPVTNMTTYFGTLSISGTGSAVLNSQNAVTHIYLYLNYTNVSTGDNYSCTETLTKF